MSAKPTSREKRWIVLADDGRHVTLGRHSDPSDEEIAQAANGLRRSGVGGWLAVLEGVYYGRGVLNVMMVREIAPPRAGWDDAVVLFRHLRLQATQTPAP